MSVFTPVSPEQLAHWLKCYSSAPWFRSNRSPPVENTNYFVTPHAGALRLALFEKLGAEDLPFYLGLMAHPRAMASLVPAPIARPVRHLLAPETASCRAGDAPAGSLAGTPTNAHCAQQRSAAGPHASGRALLCRVPGKPARREVVACNAPQFALSLRRVAALLDDELRFQARYRFPTCHAACPR